MGEIKLISQNLHLLCQATSTEQELEALRLLNLNLANIKNTTCDADLIERQYLTQSKTVLEEGNPYPLFQVTEFTFPESASLKDWVNYLFVRRYGWSEVMPTGGVLTVQRIVGVGASSQNEAAMKSDLNELLDEFLKWLLCQKLEHELISSLQYTVRQAMNHPVIRKQTLVHIFEWFRSTATVFHAEFFESCKEVIILGLTDVWSAIRSACSSKLHPITEQFNIKQLEMLFLSLVQICKDVASNWQAKEGAVMGLNVIVKRFQWVASTSKPHVEIPRDLQNGEYFLKFGNQSLQKIPEFISATLHDVIFLLLADPQLSIREHAIKAFSSYLSKCDFQEAMSSFNEVMMALCKGAGVSQEEMIECSNISTLMALPNFRWMNAYLAEGLLGLCIFLVKHIPPDCLLPGWSLSMNTLSTYLTHPASTVRQTTSKVIKFLVAKDTSNPAILKLVLATLSCNWKVNFDALSKDCLPENLKSLPESAQVYMPTNQIPNPSISSVSAAIDVSKTWEWREGRLLAYELVFQFLIKNHWLYTFGASGAMRTHADEHKRSRSPATLDALRPLQSYGGVSMRSVQSPSPVGSYNRSLNLQEPSARPLILHSESSGSLDRKFNKSDILREATLRPRFIGQGGHHSPQLKPRKFHGMERPSLLNVPRPRPSLKRRATMDHLSPLQRINSLAHHYSQRDKTRIPSRAGDGVSVTAMPLITAAKHLDCLRDDQLSVPTEVTGDAACQQQSGHNSKPKVNIENSREEWSKLIKARGDNSMSDLLMNILHQVIECVNSYSWELRRMSQQVLPGLIEVMRWYDMTLLVNYWTENLSSDTTIISYGASLSFFYSISHAAKLYPLMIDPPENWVDLQGCKKEVKKIIDCMISQLSLGVPVFVQVLKRQTLDKLTILAIQTLLTTISFVNSTNTAVSTSATVSIADAVDCIKLITVLNYPAGRIQKYKPQSHSNRLLLPGGGFLSCNPLDSEQLSVSTENLLKYLLEHIHGQLVSSLKYCDVRASYSLLPALVKFLHSQYSSLQINRSFSDSVLVILDKIRPLLMELSEEKCLVMKKKVYETKNDCFYELILCLTDKAVDKHILHMALDCLHELLQQRDSCRYILPLFKAVCSQLSAAQGTSHPGRTYIDGLEILSNDIKEYSEVDFSDNSESDSEESVIFEVDHQESLALHNSGGTTGSGRQSALSQRSGGEHSGKLSLHSDADSGSDWDSWDEEEEESNDRESVFKEFLQKIYLTFKNQDRLDELHSALKKLTPSEYKLAKSILKIYN